jgi:hypothetical protein
VFCEIRAVRRGPSDLLCVLQVYVESSFRLVGEAFTIDMGRVPCLLVRPTSSIRCAAANRLMVKVFDVLVVVTSFSNNCSSLQKNP